MTDQYTDIQALTSNGAPLDLPIAALLKTGWKAFTETWIVAVLIMLIWWIPYLIVVILIVSASQGFVVAYFFFYFISPLPMMMLTLLYLRRHAKQDTSSVMNVWGDVTLGLYFRYLLGSLLVGLLVSIGFFLLIIPGIYLAVCWMWWSTDLLYKKKAGSLCDDIWISMKDSRAQVIRNWCSVFLFVLVLYVIQWLASITFIGVFIAVPVIVYAVTEAYLYAIGASNPV
jgi:hypothetical protein